MLVWLIRSLWVAMQDSDSDEELQRIKRWRARAEEVRVNAEVMRDATARQTLLRVAEQYDLLADSAERQLTGLGGPSKQSG
jgi:hypothetical protein